jgi:hypothetical protein
VSGVEAAIHGGDKLNATVTHSRISNQVHTVSKPYRPGFTRMDPHLNPCQFLRIPWRRKIFLGHFQIFLQIFQFCINIRIEPVRTASTRFNRTDPCRIPHDIHSHDPDLIRVKMSRIGDWVR